MAETLRDRVWPVERKWLEFRSWLGDKVAGDQCTIRCRDCGSCGEGGCCPGNTCGYIRCRFGGSYEDDLRRVTQMWARNDSALEELYRFGFIKDDEAEMTGTWDDLPMTRLWLNQMELCGRADDIRAEARRMPQ